AAISAARAAPGWNGGGAWIAGIRPRQATAGGDGMDGCNLWKRSSPGAAADGRRSGHALVVARRDRRLRQPADDAGLLGLSRFAPLWSRGTAQPGRLPLVCPEREPDFRRLDVEFHLRERDRSGPAGSGVAGA